MGSNKISWVGILPLLERAEVTNGKLPSKYHHDIYCAFHKHANSEVEKPTDGCIFFMPSIILTDLLGNNTLL